MLIKGLTEMKIRGTTHDDTPRNVNLCNVKVSDASDSYRLSFSNNLKPNSTSMLDSNYQRFTTADRDNDSNSTHNCAAERGGAWWFNRCHDDRVNLNGDYLVPGTQSNRGYLYKGFSTLTLKSSTMMMRFC